MLIKIEEVERAQQVNINGIRQNVVNKFCIISCPCCKSILNQASGSYINIVKSLNVSQEIKYCPNCATKIDYPTIIDLPKENIRELVI